MRTLQGRVVEDTFYGQDSMAAQLVALEKFPAATFLFIASGQ